MNDEKNRAISESIEPMPDGTKVAEVAWRSTWHSEYEVEHGKPGFWTYEPLAFDTDENASAMLLERMSERFSCVQVTFNSGHGWILSAWNMGDGGPCDEVEGNWQALKRICIRDAYYAWITKEQPQRVGEGE